MQSFNEVLAFYMCGNRGGMEEIRALPLKRKLLAYFSLELLLGAVVVMFAQKQTCPIGHQGNKKP